MTLDWYLMGWSYRDEGGWMNGEEEWRNGSYGLSRGMRFMDCTVMWDEILVVSVL